MLFCLTLAGLVVTVVTSKSIFTRRIKIVARFYWIIITSEIFICCKYYFVIKCLALFPWRAASRSCSYSCFIELVTFQSMSALHCCTNSFDICRALLPCLWITGCIQVNIYRITSNLMGLFVHSIFALKSLS